MRSMTGFGCASAVTEGRRLSVEVRAVNGRGLDIKVRGSGLDPEAELALLARVRARVARGSVTVTIEEEQGGGAVDAERIRGAAAQLERLRAELAIAAPLDLATIAAFLDDRGVSLPRRAGLAWPAIAALTEAALDLLVAMRDAEGAALAKDLGARVRRLGDLSGAIAARTADAPARGARRLSDRVATVLATLTGTNAVVDPARLAQEVALLADRLDVSEELVRLDTHRARLAAWIDGTDDAATNPVGGRRIEFLVQEMGRELNTIGSKTQDAETSALVVDGKAELEKIREQAQNIE